MGVEELIKYVAGPLGALALSLIVNVVLWKDNKEYRREQRELLERVITALVSVTSAIQSFRRIVGRGDDD